jgi:hypothetical protein
MTEESNSPQSVFEEYVKSVIIKIAGENNILLEGPTSPPQDLEDTLSGLLNGLHDIENTLSGLDFDALESLSNFDVSEIRDLRDEISELREVKERLEAIETVLAEVNSATMSF